MKWHLVALVAPLTLPLGMATSVLADAQWTGDGRSDLWSNPANWDPGIPVSATVRDNPPAPPSNFNNLAVNQLDGTNILIRAGIDAVAFGVQIGFPKDGTLGGQSASNTLTMTGGTLTTQGNFLFNIGRGRNPDFNPGHLVQFNMSGGLVNAAGITVPEAFNPDNVLGFTSGGINAEMHVSGNSVINTDLLRLGAQDSNSTVVLRDNAQVNLNDANNGFATGQLWLEAFEDLDDTRGVSVLDIRDNAVMTIHGGVNNNQDLDESLKLIREELVPRNMIVANGGADPVQSQLVNGVIVLRAIPFAALLGDANNDNLVTGGDLISILQNFGKDYTNGACDGMGLGDANDDCLVTGADVISVQQNFGKTAAPAVPEPAAVLLWGLGLLVAARWPASSRLP